MGCSSLATVTFEKGSQLKTIGGGYSSYYPNYYGAFADCTALTSIEIPASVETIEAAAFMRCSKLATVTFEKGSQLKTIGGDYSSSYYYGVFSDCTALKSIEIPASVETIEAAAFSIFNSKTIEERELRHYLYVLDGVENRIKELRKFPSLTFDLNYIEQTEIDQLAQQIETTMQSDLKAKDQLLKKIRNNPLCNVDMENIIQRRNWKYKKLNNTIKGNRFSWLELYQQAGIKNSVSQFISGYMSEFVHGLCMSNIAYNTPPFEKGQILNINTVFINKTTDIIKKLFQNDLAKNDIDIRKSDIATSLLLMVTPEYISEKLLQIADKTKATQHS